MGEEDPFGELVTSLVNDGAVDDHDGVYSLAR